MGRPKPNRMLELSVQINERLDFDQQQQDQFKLLRDQHRSDMNKSDIAFANALDTYLLLLNENEPTDIVRDSLENVLAMIEREKATFTLRHFQKVKALCRPDQLKKFTELIPELASVLFHRKRSYHRHSH